MREQRTRPRNSPDQKRRNISREAKKEANARKRHELATCPCTRFVWQQNVFEKYDFSDNAHFPFRELLQWQGKTHTRTKQFVFQK
jgi:hypothetical protein